MERPSKKTLIPLILASIILPIGLFLGFTHSSEPNVSREITANTTAWNFSRPYNPYNVSTDTHVRECVTNSFNEDFGAVEFSFYVDLYMEESARDGDVMKLYIIFSGNLTRGFFYKLQIDFSRIDADAYLDIRVDDDVMKLQNFTTPEVQDSYSTNNPFIQTMAVSHPSSSSFEIAADWYFSDYNNIVHSVNHEFTATAKIILYDGSEYWKIQLPINLKVLIP